MGNTLSLDPDVSGLIEDQGNRGLNGVSMNTGDTGYPPAPVYACPDDFCSGHRYNCNVRFC